MIFLVVGAICVAAYFVWDYYHHKHYLPTPKEKCIFVTGCDSGFGRALAHKLNELGCHVYAGCFTDDGMVELKTEGNNIVPIRVDVTDTESIKRAYAEVKNHLDDRELWGVVNNAGIPGTGGPVELQSSRDNFIKVFNTNMVGMAEVGRVFLPLLKQSRGRLVNMASIAGLVGLPDMGDYVASKFAMEGYSHVQRRELRRYGVSVSILNPGLFRTALLNPDAYTRTKAAQWEAADPEVREQLGGEEFLQTAIDANIRIFTKKSASNINPVLDAYIHALFAINPRTRYLVGKDAMQLGFLHALLPAQILDKILEMRGRIMSPMLGR